jgi:hypothetical protein
MKPPKTDPIDVLELSPGYSLRLTWDEGRRTLNQSPLYQALRKSDGLLKPEFVDSASTLAKYSRRVEAALELATLVREVAAGKHATPGELFGRAAKFLGLRSQTLIDSAEESPGEGAAATPEISSYTPNGSDTGQTVTGQATDSTALKVPESPASTPPARELFDFALKVLQGTLTSEERVQLFEGVRREVLESSQKSALLDIELQRLLGTKTSFVRHMPLYFCPCGPLGHEPLAACPLCSRPPTEHPLAISTIQSDLDRILAANIWLELGVARVFDAHGFVPYVGSRPVGLSGASHEVDILAWDPLQKHLLLTEVTTEVASMDRLGRVLVRREDIRVHASSLVTLGPATEDVIEYGRRHAIGVVPDIRRNVGQLEKWIDSTRKEFGNNRNPTRADLP